MPKADSPDGKLHAVMDIDRDSTIDPEWKGDNYPRVEISEKATGRILTSIKYFGAASDDARPLREHVQVKWRCDSKAFAVTIQDRFYSSTKIFAMNEDSKFVEVQFPSYAAMTGFPAPNVDQLRSRGRSTVEGWDEQGRLIYHIFYSPLPSYSGKDPLEHKIMLDVSAAKMVPIRAGTTKPSQAGLRAAGKPAGCLLSAMDHPTSSPHPAIHALPRPEAANA